MAKKSLSRRKFLQGTAVGAGAWALSSCASMDRWIMGDPYDLRQEVVILGGGLAGLTAAFELKKRQIPFRVFEASSRVGGRVQTLNFGEGDWADVGGEFVADNHFEVKSLAKELSLTLANVNSPQTQYFLNNRVVSASELNKALATVVVPFKKISGDLFRGQNVVVTSFNASSFDRAGYYDSMSLKDLLQSLSKQVSTLALEYIESFAVNRYGVEASGQSSLHFLNDLTPGGGFPLMAQQRFEGGAGKLTQTLAERVVGVLQNRVIKMNHALVDISRRGEVYSLKFKTPNGTEEYRTRKIICTLPVGKMREIPSLMSLPWDDGVLAALQKSQYASHTKGVVELDGHHATLNSYRGMMLSQNIWPSNNETKRYSFYTGGSAGKLANVKIGEELVRDLRRFKRDFKIKDNVQMVNWLHRKWSLGSKVVYAPGEFAKYKGAFSAPALDGSFLFAGEHSSDRFAGTMQGAIESALRSVSRV